MQKQMSERDEELETVRKELQSMKVPLGVRKGEKIYSIAKDVGFEKTWGIFLKDLKKHTGCQRLLLGVFFSGILVRCRDHFPKMSAPVFQDSIFLT